MLGLFLPKHELYDDSRERHIKSGGHLGGFGADVFEINKLKEKIEHCAYLQGALQLIKSLYEPELMCRKVNLMI